MVEFGQRFNSPVGKLRSQTDLPQPQESGLIAAQKILKSVEGIAFCYLSRADVVRHPLVQKIVSA